MSEPESFSKAFSGLFLIQVLESPRQLFQKLTSLPWRYWRSNVTFIASDVNILEGTTVAQKNLGKIKELFFEILTVHLSKSCPCNFTMWRHSGIVLFIVFAYPCSSIIQIVIGMLFEWQLEHWFCPGFLLERILGGEQKAIWQWF